MRTKKKPETAQVRSLKRQIEKLEATRKRRLAHHRRERDHFELTIDKMIDELNEAKHFISVLQDRLEADKLKDAVTKELVTKAVRSLREYTQPPTWLKIGACLYPELLTHECQIVSNARHVDATHSTLTLVVKFREPTKEPVKNVTSQ